MNTDRFDWKSQLKQIHSSYPGYKRQPIIGITGNYQNGDCTLSEAYYRAVLVAGGVPMIIPPYEERDALVSVLDSIDALVLSGGADMNPLFVGEDPVPGLHGINAKRDLAELLLISMAVDRQIPILGICRGIQMLTVAMGGTLWQDLDSQYHDAPIIKHSQDQARNHCSHTVMVDEGSLLADIMGEGKLYVNSFHHQAVRDAGDRLRVVARASDGVIEAVESTEHKSILGVQWHPECLTWQGDSSMLPLFQWIVREADSFSRARTLSNRVLTLDSHCDTPMFFHQNIQFHQRDPRILVDLHKMTEGHLDASIMVAYLPQKERDDESLLAATEKANQTLTQIEQMVANNSESVEIAYTPDDLYRLKSQGKRAIMMGIENGYALGKDISLVEHFRRRGVVYLTLCHNGDNDVCDSHRGSQEHDGVSEFGANVIREMNRVGMMVDLSHAHEKSFWDALEISSKPIVCSHSSCRALCDHTRNLTDEQMRALAAKGGVMQVTIYDGFLRQGGGASIDDVVAHVNHAVQVMGIEHVGIGTDFDGDGGVPGLANASELINLTRRLMAEGYSEHDLRLIWGENFLRVMREVQNV